MLSHHELATLMLLGDTNKRLEEAFDPDVQALRRYELVELRQRDQQGSTLQLTRQGRELLARLRTGAGQ